MKILFSKSIAYADGRAFELGEVIELDDDAAEEHLGAARAVAVAPDTPTGRSGHTCGYCAALIPADEVRCWTCGRPG